MNPMIDLAMIRASHSCRVTILTTLLNSFRYHSVTEWSRSQGLELRVVHLPFPSTQVGLSEDCENLDSITNPDMLWKFVLGVKILQQPFEDFVRKEPPNCIISNTLFPWTTQTEGKLKIPRYVFHSTNSFFYCVIAGMRSHDSDEEEFGVPGLPHEVRMRRMSDKASAGVIFNISYEIESAYVELFKSTRGCQQLWTVGPLSLISHQKGRSRQEKQGKEQSPIDEDQCLRWLESKEPRSVVYVYFGSIASLSGAQRSSWKLDRSLSHHSTLSYG
ncbi:Scopoletin glucosyltransferase [Nymphaea thermarum]|nr:Scopoletin glucosyltransferase [Nymphaea thermarum]